MLEYKHFGITDGAESWSIFPSSQTCNQCGFVNPEGFKENYAGLVWVGLGTVVAVGTPGTQNALEDL